MLSSRCSHKSPTINCNMATGSTTEETVCQCKKGRVTSDQELCLQKHTTFLVRELQCESIVSALRSKFVLDDNDQDNIIGLPGNKKSRQDQNRFLIDTLMNRTPRGFQIFLEVLLTTGHQNAYHKLTLKGEDSGESGKTQDSQTFPPKKTGTENCVNTPHNDESDTDGHCPEFNFEDQLCNVEARVCSAEVRLHNIEQYIGQTDGQENDIETVKQQLKETHTELEKLRSTYAQQSREIHNKNEQIKKTQRELADQLKINVDQSNELRDKLEELDIAKLKIEEQMKIIAQLKLKVTKLEQRSKTAEANIEQLKKDMKDTDKKILKLHLNRNEDKKLIADLQTKLATQEEQRKVDIRLLNDNFARDLKSVQRDMQKQIREELNRERRITQHPALPPLQKSQNIHQRLDSLAENRPALAQSGPSWPVAYPENASLTAAPKRYGTKKLPHRPSLPVVENTQRSNKPSGSKNK